MMFKKVALSAAAAAAAIAAVPASAEAEFSGGTYQAAPSPQRAEPRREIRRPAPRICRGGDTGSLLGAIAGGLLGRQALAPAGRQPGRICR